MKANIVFKVVPLKRNMGHGMARRISLKNCTNNLVAIMDADDICVQTRFEKQIRRFIEDSNLSLVGGQITEFVGDVTNIIDVRRVPLDHKSICDFMKKRCPFNQVTVMFKKEEVEKAGGYKDWYCEEDYYLWLRMMKKGARFANLNDILVNVRVGDEMSARRGGMKYFLSEKRLQRYMLDNHIINLWQYFWNVILRFGGEVIISDKLRSKMFKFFRTGINKQEKQKYWDILNKNKFPIETTNNYPPFSVAMSVYGKDKPEYFDIALNSIINQTVRPNEIVLVIDGPVSQGILDVIKKYCDIF